MDRYRVRGTRTPGLPISSQALYPAELAPYKEPTADHGFIGILDLPLLTEPAGRFNPYRTHMHQGDNRVILSSPCSTTILFVFNGNKVRG